MSFYLIHLINGKFHLKYAHRGGMAEWAHKEATWIPRIVFKEKFWDCPECQEANFAWRTECNNCGAPGVAVELVGPSFPEWLDQQCRGGWELFKIFRNHNSGANDCIFRRLV